MQIGWIVDSIGRACLSLPAIAQDASYHAFADQRPLLGIPNAADVLSNLGFVVVAIAGFVRLAARNRVKFSAATESALWSMAIGFLFTAIGSTWYHLNPTNATLVWDRLAMTLVFAGVLAASVAQRVSGRASRIALPLLLIAGPASVLYWKATGNLLPYGLVQYGGFAILVVILALRRRDDDAFPWWWAVLWYFIAKLFELGDQAVWQASNGVVAGHALKHIAAAMAGIALLSPLRRRATWMREESESWHPSWRQRT